MTREDILAELFRLRDAEYAAFQARLLPTVPRERIIGVRTPALRSLAKGLRRGGDTAEFLSALPHPYFDEDQLHAFVISLEKDFDRCLAAVEAFLPCVDNWATCDQLSPQAFKKEPERLLPSIESWLRSGRTYTVRFAVGMLMQHFLDERFEPRWAELVASVRSEEYYVRMMAAWYFATALAKQYDAVLPFLTENRLDPWTHNKTIQKCAESFRIPPERKGYLKTLKR